MPTLTGALGHTGHMSTLLLHDLETLPPSCNDSVGGGALVASSDTARLDECSTHSAGKYFKALGA